MMRDLCPIETQLLKVPFEALKREARDRKGVVEKANAISVSIAQLAANSKQVDLDAACQQLAELAQELEALQQQNDSTSALEEAEALRCHERVCHLAEISNADSTIDWNRKRLLRILVDHLLREGHWETADALVAETGCQHLVDLNVFQDARRVVESLRTHDCSLALQWCNENAAKLKRWKSKLQFRLHIQVFIELVKRGSTMEALAYAQKELTAWAVTDLPEFRRIITLLVFGAKTTCSRYKPLLAEKQWEVLVNLFLQELYKINSMTAVSVLEIHLQAGLTALKSPLSYEEKCTKEDPLHLPHLKQLAESLPWAKHEKSKLVCAISKTIMNDGNPPMALPNGYVYSREALEARAAQDNGFVTCPVTSSKYSLKDCSRAYIM